MSQHKKKKKKKQGGGVSGEETSCKAQRPTEMEYPRSTRRDEGPQVAAMHTRAPVTSVGKLTFFEERSRHASNRHVLLLRGTMG
jgi:hypothetical protein